VRESSLIEYRAMKHTLTCLAAACLAIAGTTCLAQQPFERPAAAGQMVDVGGRKLHIRCTGPVGGPTVIVEGALATWSSHYKAMQDAVAESARICTYDRAGLGWSDPAPAGRTFQDMSADLTRVLKAAKIAPPYVVVGHSLGGLVARTFVREHPKDVAAVVLIESSNEMFNFSPAYSASRSQRIAMIDSGLKIGKPGVPVLPMPPNASPEAIMSMTPEVLATTKDELNAFERTPESQRKAAGFGTLGQIPLVVIRRGKPLQPATPGMDEAAWTKSQEDLLKLSSNSRMVVAENSGHMVPLDEPQLVAAVIREALEPLRRR
jgi:pimeloyl-ACP methyl ester carboxylesterase